MMKAVLIFITSLLCLDLWSQSFQTLQFSIPDISPGYDLGKPNSTYHPFKGQVLHLVLKDNTYAVVKKDSRGDILHRDLYDFNSNKYYSVGKWEDEWIYITDTIPPNYSFYHDQNNVYDLFYRGLAVEPERVNIKGFSCYVIKMVSKQFGKVTLFATDQIKLPTKSNAPFHHPTLLDSVVILKALFETETREVMAAVDTLYTTLQNPEWLLPFQEGAITREEYQKIEFNRILDSTYNQQVNKGKNLDIGIALYNHGLLSEDDVRSRVQYNEDVDKLYWLNKTEYLSRSITYDSLIKVWIKTGLISPGLHEQIDQYRMQHWTESRELFFSMMSLLMLRDMLAERKIRETILANMSPNRYEFGPGSEKMKADFLDGKVDISSLFLALNGMYPIPSFYKTKGKGRIEDEVRHLLILIFPDLENELKVWISQDAVHSLLHVSTKKFDYQTEIYREYDWDEEEEIKPLKELKEFDFDAEFLSDFEKILKQVGTDYQNNRVYGFRSFAQGISNVKPEDYEWLIQKYPELALFTNLWYVGAFDRRLADWMADIKISFRTTDLAHYQSQFNSLYLCSSLADYLPTEKKNNVMEFMRRHQQDLNLSDDNIKTTQEEMQYALIKLGDGIGSWIPGIEYFISSLPEEFVSPIPTNTSFSDFFPYLYHFIRQDYNPMLMGLSADLSELYWKDESGEMDTIPMNHHSTEESILAFLNKEVKPNGHSIYTIPTILTEKPYYYLTPQQKEELEIILDARLYEIK